MTNYDYENVTISDGEIWLQGLAFSTLDYQPPQHQRSISYEDTAIAEGDTVVMTRSVTDLGPLMGVWQPFHILCENVSNWDPPQRYRGQKMYDNLLHLFQGFVGRSLELVERNTGNVYHVMFTQDGLTPAFMQQRSQVQPNPITGEDEDWGMEYSVQLSFIEVPA